jgi:hypothetical protein
MSVNEAIRAIPFVSAANSSLGNYRCLDKSKSMRTHAISAYLLNGEAYIAVMQVVAEDWLLKLESTIS